MTTSTIAEAPVKRPRRRTVRRNRFGIAPLRGLLILVGFLLVWQLVGSPTSSTFPRPSQWFTALQGLLRDGVLIPALRNTLTTFAVSLGGAVLLGVVSGIALGLVPTLERLVAPIIDFFRTLPPPALVPVAAILLGPTLKASVVIIVLAIVWPIVLNTVVAVRSMPSVRTEMSQSLGISRPERFVKILLPSLAPGIFIGTKVAVSISLIVTLLVDILGYADGAGRLIVERQQYFDSASVWGLLLIIGVFGYLLNVVLSVAEALIMRHRPGR